jgi:putative transposase
MCGANEARRRKPLRLPSRDYTSPGWYFVTMCTKDRNLLFGRIRENRVHQSRLGRVARDYWLRVPEHSPNMDVDEFVIMPNHVHGILINISEGTVGTLHRSSRTS